MRTILVALCVVAMSVDSYAGKEEKVLRAFDVIIDAVQAHSEVKLRRHVDLKHFISRFLDDVLEYGFISYEDDTAVEAGTKFVAAGVLRGSLEGLKARGEKLVIEEVKSGKQVNAVGIAECRRALAGMRDRNKKNDLMSIKVSGQVAVVEMGLRLKDAAGPFKVPVRLQLVLRGKRWVVRELVNMQEILTNRRVRAVLMKELNRELFGWGESPPA